MMSPMKKLLAIIILSLCFITPSQANDIRDFQIEGISIGDSLLGYMSSKKIKSELERTRPNYSYIDFKYGAVYLQDDLKQYDFLSFFVKPNDKRYLIHGVRGGIIYNEKLKECLQKRNEISEEIDQMFKGAKKIEKSFKSRLDPSGKSFKYEIAFVLNSGAEITLVCSDWEENLRKEKNWVESLSIAIETENVVNWLKGK